MTRYTSKVIASTVLALLIVLCDGRFTNAATIAGKARVINGDTLVVGGKRIGLYGIDAPKDSYRCIIKNKRARCGNGAGPALARKIGKRRVVCATRGRDKKQRHMAVCHAGPENLNAWMVAIGWAEAVDGSEDLDIGRLEAKMASVRQQKRISRKRTTALRPSNAHAVSGQVQVINGDTVEVAGKRIRLFGIDAPERDQTCSAKGKNWRCGQSAAIALTKIIGLNLLHCHKKDDEADGTTIADCTLRDDGGPNIAGLMVKDGWAMAYRRVSSAYVEQERAARKAKLGIWRGKVMAPWEWRQAQGKNRTGPIVLKRNAQPPCIIKGEISERGERIYHVRGGALYGRTSIDLSKGERWFCNEKEARTAGWRRARK